MNLLSRKTAMIADPARTPSCQNGGTSQRRSIAHIGHYKTVPIGCRLIESASELSPLQRRALFSARRQTRTRLAAATAQVSATRPQSSNPPTGKRRAVAIRRENQPLRSPQPPLSIKGEPLTLGIPEAPRRRRERSRRHASGRAAGVDLGGDAGASARHQLRPRGGRDRRAELVRRRSRPARLDRLRLRERRSRHQVSGQATRRR
jgi:hypothetical protein